MPNGGFNIYNSRQTTKKFAHPNPEPRTVTLLLLGNQVVRAGTWLETNSLGKAIPHSGLTQNNTNILKGVAGIGDTVTASFVTAGVTYNTTLTVTKPMTAAEVVQAFANITAFNMTAPSYTITSNLIALPPPFGTGSTPETLVIANEDFNGSQSMTLYESSSLTILASYQDAGVPSQGALATVDLGSVGGGLVSTIVKPDLAPIAGLLKYDVIAVADTLVQVYVSGSFWADDGFVKWQSLPSEHFVTDPTTLNPVPCTYYNAGCFVDLQYQRFTQNTEFHIETQLAGEKEI